jgi:hypothetical protein
MLQSDDLLHLIATGGSGVATLAALGAIWLVSQLRSDLRDLRAEFEKLSERAEKHGRMLARLDERTKE